MTHLCDITRLIWFFFDELYEIREPQLLIPKKGTVDDALLILKKTHEQLSSLTTFDREEIEESMRILVEEIGLKVGQVFMTVRVAVTGSKVSPGLFETMDVLSKDVVLRRLLGAVDVLKKTGG